MYNGCCLGRFTLTPIIIEKSIGNLRYIHLNILKNINTYVGYPSIRHTTLAALSSKLTVLYILPGTVAHAPWQDTSTLPIQCVGPFSNLIRSVYPLYMYAWYFKFISAYYWTFYFFIFFTYKYNSIFKQISKARVDVYKLFQRLEKKINPHFGYCSYNLSYCFILINCGKIFGGIWSSLLVKHKHSLVVVLPGITLSCSKAVTRSVMFFIKDCRAVSWFVIYVTDDAERRCSKADISDVDTFWFIASVTRRTLFSRLWSLDNISVKLVLVKVWKWLASSLSTVNFNTATSLLIFRISLELVLPFIKDSKSFVKLKNIEDWFATVDLSLSSSFVFSCKVVLICITSCIRKTKASWWEELLGVVFCWLFMLSKRRPSTKIKCRIKTTKTQLGLLIFSKEFQFTTLISSLSDKMYLVLTKCTDVVVGFNVHYLGCTIELKVFTTWKHSNVFYAHLFLLHW